MSVLGLDVGKDELFACFRSAGQQAKQTASQFANTPTGHRKLVSWLEKIATGDDRTHVVMESTSVYWESIAICLHEAGHVVSVVNAAQIKFFAKSLLRRGKTDVLDAELIAHYGEVMRPACWTPPEAELMELRALVRGRDAVVELITLEKGRHHAMEHQARPTPTALEWVEARQGFLEAQLKAANQAIGALIKSSAALQSQVDVLVSVPGVGLLTAVTLLTETMHMGGMTHSDQWAAFAGLSPMPCQSGNFTGKTRMSRIGNARLRRAFYLCALTSSRMDNPLGDFYRRLSGSGKPKKVALIALARKIIRICFAVLKSGVVYDPAHSRNIALTA